MQKPRRFSVAGIRNILWVRGWYRSYQILFCPACDYQTRVVRKARAHECEPDRAGKRRIMRAAKKAGTVHV